MFKVLDLNVYVQHEISNGDTINSMSITASPSKVVAHMYFKPCHYLLFLFSLKEIIGKYFTEKYLTLAVFGYEIVQE